MPHLVRRVQRSRPDPRCQPSALPAASTNTSATDPQSAAEPTADLAVLLADATVRGVAARRARRLNGAVEADDLLQAAALRVLRSGRQPSIALVHVALRHEWIDHHRRYARRPGDRPDAHGVDPNREGSGWQVVAAGSRAVAEDPLEAVTVADEHDAVCRRVHDANRTLRGRMSHCGVSDREWQALRVVTDPNQPASDAAERKAASRARTKLRPLVRAWLAAVTAPADPFPAHDAHCGHEPDAAQVDAVLRLAGMLEAK